MPGRESATATPVRVTLPEFRSVIDQTIVSPARPEEPLCKAPDFVVTIPAEAGTVFVVTVPEVLVTGVVP